MICVHDRTTQEQAEAWQPLLLIHTSSGPELSMPPLARCVLCSYSFPPRQHCVTACTHIGYH